MYRLREVMKSFVSLSDIHYPYEDKDAMILVKKFLADFHPDILILNGDIYDCPQLSKYSQRHKEAANSRQLGDDLAYGLRQLGELIDLANPQQTHFISGNHEDRLNSYVGRNAPAIASVINLDTGQLFAPPTSTFYPYGSGLWLTDSLFVYHGTRIGINWTAAEQRDVGASTITGHQHRQGVTYHRDRSRQYKNVGQGCLCRLDPPYMRVPPDWQQGFAFGWVWGQDRFRVVEAEIVRGEEASWTAPLGKIYRSDE